MILIKHGLISEKGNFIAIALMDLLSVGNFARDKTSQFVFVIIMKNIYKS